MSQALHRPQRAFSAIVLSLVIALAGGVAADASAAAPVAQQAALAPADAGAYYVFRTRDTGEKPTKDQNSRCDKFFGLRGLTTVTRLNALLFAYESNAATGRIENQTKSLLGPGFICGVPNVSLSGITVDAYAYSSLPGPGLVEGDGNCAIAPVMVNNLPIVLNCALQIKKDATKGIAGGLITSNSLVNTINRSDSAPTGSVWTANVIGSATNTGGGSGTIPPDIKPETPGLDFFVTRTRDEVVTTGESEECRRAGLAATPLAIRTTNLAVAQPDPNSGRVPDAAGAAVAKMTVCYAYSNKIGYRAFAIADLKTALGPFSVRASGDCKNLPTAAGTAYRAQACALTVKSGAAKGGLITSNGLIESGKPASAASSSIWTFALFGAPAAA
ncbi:MAG: hypothetical protein Q7T55_13615 [Solirubrobacteraceae bacterium]|nr:hypothetical protein [Solirubrobacteraceae bacterium]